MARNEEKAQSMLNRWWAFKTGEDKKERKRPYLASKCNNIVACEKWRLQILHEIGQKVQEIQSVALGEHKLRQLNDEINKLIREKGHWERRILELGGPNYLSSSVPTGDDDGQVVEPGGYRYFGAARELPGVKQLFFQQQSEEKKKKTRTDLYNVVDADYYGFRDDEDGKLEDLERAAEEIAIASAIKEWEQASGKRWKPERDDDEGDEELSGANVFVVPSTEAIEKALIERRKQDLLRKYATSH